MRNVSRFTFTFSLFLSKDLHILGIDIPTSILKVLHIFKNEHRRLLYVIVRNRPDREYPYFSRISILARLCLSIRLVNKLYQSTVNVFTFINNFKEMYIYAVVSTSGKRGILSPVNILISVFAHTSIVENSSDPFVVIDTLCVV